MLISIDTSVVIGLLDSQDLWHPSAVSLQEALTAAGLGPVYFDCVLAESVSTLARRLREKRREGELHSLLDHLSATFPAEAMTWILPDVPRLHSQVMELLRSSEGELNFNDSLIALACRERQIEVLASFDRDFDRVPWLRRVATSEDVKALLTVTGKPPPDQE